MHIMYSSVRLFSLLIHLFILVICCEAYAASAIPIEQNNFCAILSATRKEYDEILSKRKYIDKQNDLKAIMQKRVQRIKILLGTGVVNSWKVKIHRIRQFKDKGYILSVALCSGIKARSGEYTSYAQNLPVLSKASDEYALIKPGTPVYESLRRFQEGDTATVSGKFLPYDSGWEQGTRTSDDSSFFFQFVALDK